MELKLDCAYAAKKITKKKIKRLKKKEKKHDKNSKKTMFHKCYEHWI